MTLTELYQSIDGDLGAALQIMRMEKLVSKHVLKLGKGNLGDMLSAAEQSMDPTAIFEATHAMKGVCANLGLTKLSAAASELTEEFRPGAARKMTDGEVRDKLAALRERFGNTLGRIAQYEAELP